MPTLSLSQSRLLDALARPMLVADVDGQTLYETPALRECLTGASTRERIELERELGNAVGRLCAYARNHTLSSAKPVVLDRHVLTQRSAFRLRGVLVPPPVLMNGVGVLLELERTDRRAVRMEDLCLQFGLTARQAEVAELVARGLSDHAIATRLGISLRTAEHHTEHVLHKLGADCRSAVAALLARSNPD
jgi:DNA-binding CsgD family transcriptional regulator